MEKALVAVGIGGLYVFLDYEGETLEFEIMEVSASPNDVLGDGTFPDETGIYFWSGRPKYTPYRTPEGGSEQELTWENEVIRKATVQDVIEFGHPSLLYEKG